MYYEINTLTELERDGELYLIHRKYSDFMGHKLEKRTGFLMSNRYVVKDCESFSDYFYSDETNMFKPYVMPTLYINEGITLERLRFEWWWFWFKLKENYLRIKYGIKKKL